jgi:hypothetical protein
MIEKIKPVSNPLTIIAIFAALAEVAGTVAIATVDKSLQGIFIWFVMGFPVLLVTAFFLTLNFNSRVLYAPSDFKKEELFLELTFGRASLDRQVPQTTIPDKLALTSGSLKKSATGSLFWLGHDLMWSADTLLRQGATKDILVGLDQAMHHLAQVGLKETAVDCDLQALRGQIQASKELSPSFRDECANKIGSTIDRIGATLEAAQSDFQKPPYWNRLR